MEMYLLASPYGNHLSLTLCPRLEATFGLVCRRLAANRVDIELTTTNKMTTDTSNICEHRGDVQTTKRLNHRGRLTLLTLTRFQWKNLRRMVAPRTFTARLRIVHGSFDNDEGALSIRGPRERLTGDAASTADETSAAAIMIPETPT